MLILRNTTVPRKVPPAPWPPSSVIARSAVWQRVVAATGATGAVEEVSGVVGEVVDSDGVEDWTVMEFVAVVDGAADGCVPPPHPTNRAAANPAALSAQPARRYPDQVFTAGFQ